MSTSAIDPVVADAPVDSTPAAAVETTPATKDAAGGAVSAVVEQKSSGEVKENTDAQVPAVTEETKSGEETKVVSKDAEKDKAGEETKTAVKVEEKSKTGAKVTESKTNGEKPRGRGQFNHRNNSKAILDALPVTDDPVAIRKQVEFYFSDSNLPRDNFLWSKVEGALNLPVPISVIHSFKRMRRFQPLEAVVSALKDSRVLDVVDQDSCVQRKVPFTLAEGTQQEIFKIIEDESLACSVYVKGFGEEKPDTQFKIEGFFMPHGTTNQVRLRRAKDKTFKGSVFVEFENEETAKKFIGLDPQPTYEGCKLTIKSKKQYMEEKAALYADGKLKKSDDNRDRLQSSRWTRGGRGGRGSRGFGRGRGGRESKDNGRDSRSSRYRDEAKKATPEVEKRPAEKKESAEVEKTPVKAEESTAVPEKKEPAEVVKAPIKTEEVTATPDKKVEAAKAPEVASSGVKRTRETDTTDLPPAKKVDSKE